jgi:hypothetical protein
MELFGLCIICCWFLVYVVLGSSLSWLRSRYYGLETWRSRSVVSFDDKQSISRYSLRQNILRWTYGWRGCVSLHYHLCDTKHLGQRCSVLTHVAMVLDSRRSSVVGVQIRGKLLYRLALRPGCIVCVPQHRTSGRSSCTFGFGSSMDRVAAGIGYCQRSRAFDCYSR